MNSPLTTRTVRVDLGPRSYEIAIVDDALPATATVVANWLAQRPELGVKGQKAFIVTDSNVRKLHAETVRDGFLEAGWDCRLEELAAGEKAKDLAIISSLYDRLVEIGADRRTVVVAVGGGVIGDAAGFAAATYARGLPFVQVPTTLLAQVDSSVGGKVGVNHPRGKNLIGAFHQPVGVYIDTATLRTLPDRDFRSGLAEVVKYGVILDAEFFAWLEANVDAINRREPDTLAHIVACSCRLKADVVEQDEFERLDARSAPSGLQRTCLNYGHTFAHAFESLAGYGQLLHGEAVAIGMLCASRLAVRRKLVDDEVTARQTALLRAFGLSTELPGTMKFGPDAILEAMRLDKKAVGGRLRFVLPTALGHVETFADIPEPDILAALRPPDA